VLAEDVRYLCAGNDRFVFHQCDVVDYMSVFEIIRYCPPTAPPAGLPRSCSSVLLRRTCVIEQSCFLQEYTAPRNLQSSSTEPCWIVFQAARAYCSSQRPGKHPIMAYTSFQSGPPAQHLLHLPCHNGAYHSSKSWNVFACSVTLICRKADLLAG